MYRHLFELKRARNVKLVKALQMTKLAVLFMQMNDMVMHYYKHFYGYAHTSHRQQPSQMIPIKFDISISQNEQHHVLISIQIHKYCVKWSGKELMAFRQSCVLSRDSCNA